ncbi:MAG: glycosyltransferase family 39 protein [Solirubrobacteraceae bacterium]
MPLPARTGAPPSALAGAAPPPASGRETQRSRAVGGSPETRIVIGLTVVAALLRLLLIDHQSYWLDESQAAHELSLSFGSMLGAWNSAEWNPPLYLIVAWPWAQVFGTGEAGLRSLSALLGTALIPLLYLAGRELVSRRAGVVAAALATVNPFMIWYAQEAREYVLLVLLCTASLLYFARAYKRPSPGALAWWAVISALALLTQYFAGFLVAAEGIVLVYRARSRASVMALALQALVLAPLIPHVLPRFNAPTTFITSQSLSVRLQQVPVTFALNTLYYKGSIVSLGLLGAAVVAAAVIALLVAGADPAELRGAGIAAGLAGFVLLVPLGLALIGHDDFIARGLMPAWPPLAIVLGAACTARHARLPGAILAAVLLTGFVVAGVVIDTTPAYQRTNWRAVAAALGGGSGARAIAAYPDQFATGPLSLYLRRVPWSGPGEPAGTGSGPVTIRELDVIANAGLPSSRLPSGMHRLSARTVDGYEIDRFRLSPPWPTDAAAVQARAQQLFGPPAPQVIIQHAA